MACSARGQALDCGYTPEQIRERLSDRRWERIRHGQYAEVTDQSTLTPWERETARYRKLVHAVMNSMRPGSVAVSHQSALVLHGIPVWGVDLSEVHLTRLDRRRHTGLVAGVRRHRGLVTAADLDDVDRVLTIRWPRAVLETACTTSFEAAVVIADAALHERAIGDEELRRLLELIAFWPGSPTARAALNFSDPRSESVGESRLRVLMYNHGLPAPVLQAVFTDADGFIARVDFYFPEFDTVVEFDGFTKYSAGTAEVLVREKTREDRLRAIGLQVVRTTWSDLDHPARTVARIRAAFTRSRRTP